MPQMSPLSWTMIFFVLLFLFLIVFSSMSLYKKETFKNLLFKPTQKKLLW